MSHPLPRARLFAWACVLMLTVSVGTAGAQEKKDEKAVEKPKAVKAKGDKTKPAGGTAAAEPAVNPAAPGGTTGPGDGGPTDESELYRCKNLPRNAKFKVTLKPETDLKELVQWAMSFTCRNFIFGQNISGRASKVTIIAPSEMTPAEAWNLFLVALQTMNLTVVPKGKTLELVEAPQAKEGPLPVYKPGNAPNSDQIVRVVIRPDNVGVDDMAQMFNSLKSRDGVVTPFPNWGVIIVTDYGSSIDKMVDVMKTVDVAPDGEKVYIIKIHNADAVELGQKLNEIFGSAAGGRGGQAAPQAPRATKEPRATAKGGGDVTASAATPGKIIPDERTNSLIVIASEPAYARILALVRRLDQPGESGDGRIHVYYLENADAEELSNTLGTLISGQPQRAGGGGRGQQAQAPAPAPSAGGGASGTAFEGNVKVTFDKPTNSIVIVSSDRDFIAMRDVIRRLDKPRRQVFVEATILEVSLDKTRKMGVSWHGGVPTTVEGQDALIVGGVQSTDLSTLQLNPASFIGGIGGVIGDQIPESQQILGVSIPSFGVLFQLLQNNNDINVLSSPHILTTDNVPAEISVGDNIPFASQLGGTAGGAGGVTGGFGFGPSIQRQDVGLKLKITPHVNDSDMVRLEIEQEINEVKSENFGGLGPAWSKRTVKTSVVVKDQQPVVIGGLMQDKTLIRESKVPLFGDIPILGYLFKYTSKTKTKTNLLIFLTPYVIKDQADIRRIFEKKVRERREFLRAYSSFTDDRDFEPDIDYTRKRGLIEDINQTVRQADEDAEMLREATGDGDIDTTGPVELPPGLPDDDGDGDTGDGEPPPPPGTDPNAPSIAPPPPKAPVQKKVN